MQRECVCVCGMALFILYSHTQTHTHTTFVQLISFSTAYLRSRAERMTPTVATPHTHTHTPDSPRTWFRQSILPFSTNARQHCAMQRKWSMLLLFPLSLYTHIHIYNNNTCWYWWWLHILSLWSGIYTYGTHILCVLCTHRTNGVTKCYTSII